MIASISISSDPNGAKSDQTLHNLTQLTRLIGMIF